jgi:uncharacterized membrane protein YphA (DoxX/SURF4 family)
MTTRLFDRLPPAPTVRWAARAGIPALRVSLGLVFVWFGVPKFWSGVSPADQLAIRTMGAIDGHTVPPGLARVLLATMETTIGIGLLTARFLPIVLALLAVQMTGTLTPLVFFRHEMWTHILVPSLEGQYIIKNLVLISGAVTIAATLHGGGLVSSPVALRSDRTPTRDAARPDPATADIQDTAHIHSVLH